MSQGRSVVSLVPPVACGACLGFLCKWSLTSTAVAAAVAAVAHCLEAMQGTGIFLSAGGVFEVKIFRDLEKSHYTQFDPGVLLMGEPRFLWFLESRSVSREVTSELEVLWVQGSYGLRGSYGHRVWCSRIPDRTVRRPHWSGGGAQLSGLVGKEG
jgi:hypothetical protein